MRVALLTNHPKNTGVGRYAIALFNKLKTFREIDVELFEFDRADRRLYRTVHNNRIAVKQARKIMIFDNFIFNKHGLSNLFFDYRLGRNIPKDYDLYHLTNQIISNLGYYKNIKRTVITVHDLDYYTYPLNFAQKILSRLVYKGVEKCDFIISISKSTKNAIMQHFGIPEDRIKVIYHGVDDIFKPLKQSDFEDIYGKYNLDRTSQYILHVGVDLPRKNFITLLKAFSKLIKKFNLKVKLIKIGKITKSTSKVIKSLNLQKYIVILKSVPECDLVKFYNIADVFVFPSVQEGFGFPVLEAMACGTPVITSNISSLPEVVGSAGIMLDPMDANGFARAIYVVLTNRSLKEEMGKKSLERARKFSWKKCAKKTLDTYKEVLGHV